MVFMANLFKPRRFLKLISRFLAQRVTGGRLTAALPAWVADQRREVPAGDQSAQAAVDPGHARAQLPALLTVRSGATAAGPSRRAGRCCVRKTCHVHAIGARHGHRPIAASAPVATAVGRSAGSIARSVPVADHRVIAHHGQCIGLAEFCRKGRNRQLSELVARHGLEVEAARLFDADLATARPEADGVERVRLLIPADD